MGFDDVGGMDDLKKQIRLKIIEPMKHPELYRAYGKKVGGSLLMYGPPGCGKTYLARATAGEIDAAFYSVGLHDVLDMYIGNSEQHLHALFENAREHAPCVLFFDEVDALGASRADMRASSGRHLINQFLSELDGVDSVNDGVLILAATNAPWHLDPAFAGPGDSTGCCSSLRRTGRPARRSFASFCGASRKPRSTTTRSRKRRRSSPARTSRPSWTRRSRASSKRR